MIGPANKIICVGLGLIQIERIRLFTCQRQISFLTSFEGNQFLVKQINRSHRKWIDLRSWLNRASQIHKKQCAFHPCNYRLYTCPSFKWNSDSSRPEPGRRRRWAPATAAWAGAGAAAQTSQGRRVEDSEFYFQKGLHNLSGV